MTKTILAIVLLCLATPSHAAVKNFFTPQFQGGRLSSCLADNSTCGKPVADAFCKAEGFSESILFAREPISEAKLLDGEALCTGGSCEAFTRIKCFSGGEQTSSSN